MFSPDAHKCRGSRLYIVACILTTSRHFCSVSYELHSARRARSESTRCCSALNDGAPIADAPASAKSTNDFFFWVSVVVEREIALHGAPWLTRRLVRGRTNLRTYGTSCFLDSKIKWCGGMDAWCVYSVCYVRLLPFHHSFLTTSSSTVERRNYIIIL